MIPVDFRGFAGDPASELEVVGLFFMALPYLPFPFVITSVNDAFPDVEGLNPETGARVTCEVEVRSSHFKAHGHAPAGCDHIVCWEHDWPAAPVDVVCLRELFARIPVLQQRFMDCPRPGSLRDEFHQRAQTDPAGHTIVKHVLDVAMPAFQTRFPALRFVPDTTRHFSWKYGTGKSMLGIYPNGKLVIPGENDMAKRMAPP
jgi:hypothetical protein